MRAGQLWEPCSHRPEHGRIPESVARVNFLTNRKYHEQRFSIARVIVVLFEPFNAYPPRLEGDDLLLVAAE